MLKKLIILAFSAVLLGTIFVVNDFTAHKTAEKISSAMFTIAWADTFYENFTSLDYCNAAKTTGGWNLVDSIGYHRRKPPFERPTAGWVNTTGYPQKIAVSGDVAYCANITGIVSVRISSGTEIASADLSGGDCVDIAISGSYAYVCATDRLLKVDLSDFSEDGYALYTAYGIAVSGDYAFLGSGTGGLRSISTSSMTQASSATWTGCDARGVAIYGNFALVADAANGLAAVDISDPTAIVYLSDIGSSVGSGGYYVAVSGTLAAVAAGDSVYLVGLSELSDGDADYSMNIIARWGTKKWAYDCEFIEDKLLVADADSGTLVFYLSDTLEKSYMITSTQKNPSGISVKGIAKTSTGLICVADSEGVQFVLTGNVDPASTWADSADIGDAIAIAYSNNCVFVSCQDVGLVSVDVSDPANLVPKDTLALIPPMGLDAEGDKVYLCTARTSPNFYVIDASDPGNLNVLSSTSISANLNDVDVVGTYAYVACGDGVRKINLSDLSVADSYSSAYACISILVDGDYIYVGESEGGLLILSTSTLDSVGKYDTDGLAWGVAKSGDYCYVASKTGGLYQIDVSTPSSPTLGTWSANPIPTTTFNGEPIFVGLYDNYLLVGLLESPDNDLVLVNSATGAITYTCPSGTWLAEAAVGAGRYIVLADYGNGIKSWLLKGDVTDTLAPNTHLESRKINSSQFRYVHWLADNLQASSSPPDTVTYRLIYLSNPPAETLLIMNIDEDPPPGPLGRTYFDLGNTYDSLYWFADVVEHNLYPSATDTVWQVNSIEIEYRLTPPALLRTAGGFTYGDGETVSVVFSPEASTDIDPEDVLADADAPVFFEYRGTNYRKLALGYDQPIREVKLVCRGPITLTPFGADVVPIEVDGETLSAPTPLSPGTHDADPHPAGIIRYPYKLRHGWNMIALPTIGTAPAEDFGSSEVFFYENGYYGLTEKLEPGKGYFVWRRQEFNFVDGIPAKISRIPLKSGWNLIGGVSEPVSVYSLRTEPDSAIALYCIYTLNSDGTDYDVAEQILPKVGYWVFAFQPCTLIVDGTEDVGESLMRKNAEDLATIVLTDRTHRTKLRLGTRPDALDGFDEYDRIMPPPLPGDEIIGGLTCSQINQPLSVDVRKDGKFNLEILSDCKMIYLAEATGKSLRLEGNGLSVVLENGDEINLPRGKYALSFTREISTVPRRTKIDGVYPNPFNSRAEIVVNLAESEGDLEITDIAGRTITEFHLTGPGIRRIIWDGTANGAPCPSGIYFVKLSTDNSTETQKLLMIK